MTSSQMPADQDLAQLLFQNIYYENPQPADLEFIMNFPTLDAYMRWVAQDTNHQVLRAKALADPTAAENQVAQIKSIVG